MQKNRITENRIETKNLKQTSILVSEVMHLIGDCCGNVSTVFFMP